IRHCLVFIDIYFSFVKQSFELFSNARKEKDFPIIALFRMLYAADDCRLVVKCCTESSFLIIGSNHCYCYHYALSLASTSSSCSGLQMKLQLHLLHCSELRDTLILASFSWSLARE
ncbi:hypothetical protein X798_07961, partial [Onchocerca flexuosa]